VAALVADPARSRMLACLLSGEAATAGELARVGGVTPATASGHLARLLQARFVACEPRGRHRYYRLADADVARALEALAVVAERSARDAAWDGPGRRALREARCCYGHLAGQLGVALYERLAGAGGLHSAAEGLDLTAAGRAWLAPWEFTPAPAQRRRYAAPCMDWSERRDHLAGQLADELLQHFLDRDWLRRGAGRLLRLTPAGRQRLLPRLRAAP
jgi:DNA-binding transcriptional ArsR family regulator